MELSESKKVSFGPTEILESCRTPRFNVPTETEVETSYTPIGGQVESLRQEICHQRTPQELAGIFTGFPGITEYKRRYKWPDSGLPYEGVMNPGVEAMNNIFHILPTEPVEQISEYSRRFNWPI